MNRAALYAFVWEKPVTHVAKDFGISDVAIRKICIKHGIPTPPLGYWAKLKHGKKVARQPLPPLKRGQSDTIRLEIKPKKVMPADVAWAIQMSKEEKVRPEAQVSVPDARPPDLHPLAVACEKKLGKAKPNKEGFLTIGGAGVLAVQIGPASIERSILLIHALLSAAADRGYVLSTAGECRILVDEQPLAVRIYESKDKAAHVPTIAEIERQTKENEWRSRHKYPESTRKVYRSWNYFPSGRLILEIFDPHQQRWRADPIVGRWRDRSTRRLENQLGDAIAALKVGAVTARHQRAKENEEARIRQETEERRRDQERQRRLLDKVKTFLMEKADTYSQVAKLESLAAYLASQGSILMSDERSDLNRAIQFVLSNMRTGLTAESITEEIGRKQLLEIESWW
jgi:hypothetical protein